MEDFHFVSGVRNSQKDFFIVHFVFRSFDSSREAIDCSIFSIALAFRATSSLRPIVPCFLRVMDFKTNSLGSSQEAKADVKKEKFQIFREHSFTSSHSTKSFVFSPFGRFFHFVLVVRKSSFEVLRDRECFLFLSLCTNEPRN